MGKRLSQLIQVDKAEKEDYLLVDGEEYSESKKIKIKDIDINDFNTEKFYTKINENFVEKERNKSLSSNDFTDDDKNKLDNSQEKLKSGVNIKTINKQSILGKGNIETQVGTQVQIITWEDGD